MLLTDLDALPPADLAGLLGLSVTRGRPARGGVYVTPCPACGAERAWDRPEERRGAVVLSAGWYCWGCGAKGSRGDLCARVRFGRAWDALSREEVRAVLEGLGGYSAAPGRSWTPEPPRYLEAEIWARIVAASKPASSDGACRAWAEGRGLRLARSLLALPREPVEGLPLFDARGGWLPARGYVLGLPLSDGTGRIVSLRLRSVTGAPLKEVALPGYSSAGALYVPEAVRAAWAAGGVCPRPVVLVEGGPDWLAAAGAWWRDRDVLGYVSGSMSGSWLARLHPDTILIPQEDELSAEQVARGVKEAAGQRYARQIREGAPWVREVGMRAVYRAAGVGWRMGGDLADLAGRLPVLKKIVDVG